MSLSGAWHRYMRSSLRCSEFHEHQPVQANKRNSGLQKAAEQAEPTQGGQGFVDGLRLLQPVSAG